MSNFHFAKMHLLQLQGLQRTPLISVAEPLLGCLVRLPCNNVDGHLIIAWGKSLKAIYRHVTKLQTCLLRN